MHSEAPTSHAYASLLVEMIRSESLIAPISYREIWDNKFELLQHLLQNSERKKLIRILLAAVILRSLHLKLLHSVSYSLCRFKGYYQCYLEAPSNIEW